MDFSGFLNDLQTKCTKYDVSHGFACTARTRIATDRGSLCASKPRVASPKKVGIRGMEAVVWQERRAFVPRIRTIIVAFQQAGLGREYLGLLFG